MAKVAPTACINIVKPAVFSAVFAYTPGESTPLGNDPKFYSVSKTNSRAFGAGQLNLAIIEHITSGRLAFDQFVRFDNLNPTMCQLKPLPNRPQR